MREPNLDEELDTIRQRFYGFYLVACEDIGMRPQLLENELVDQDAAQQAALSWIEQIPTNPDLACDTRVAVPIYTMPGTVRLWVTLGVRLAFLNASYARPPKIRPQQQEAPWQEVARDDLRAAKSVIPIDEFAEVEVRTDKIPNRAELRELCDRYKTKDAIVKALADR